MLRVEGPAALEIQHQSGVILERVNRFFGWQAVGQHRACARRHCTAAEKPKPPAAPDPEMIAQIAAELPQVADESLRGALAGLAL